MYAKYVGTNSALFNQVEIIRKVGHADIVEAHINGSWMPFLKTEWEILKNEIKNREGEVLLEYELDRKDFSDISLFGADMSKRLDWSGCSFKNATLEEADFRGCNLTGCNFEEANVNFTNFYQTNLTDVNWRRTSFSGAVLEYSQNGPIVGPIRCDGHRFILTNTSDGLRVRAGCRDFSLKTARSHWSHHRMSKQTALILDYLESEAKRRGWIDASPSHSSVDGSF